MSKKKDSSKLLSVGILAAAGYFLLKGNNTKKTTTDTTSSDDSGKSSDDTTSGDGNDIHTVKSAAYRGDPHKEYDPFYDYDDDEELSDIFHQDARGINISSKTTRGIRIRVNNFKLYASRFNFSTSKTKGDFESIIDEDGFYRGTIDPNLFFSGGISLTLDDIEVFNPFTTSLTLDKVELESMEINGVTYVPHSSYSGNFIRWNMLDKADFFKIFKIKTSDYSYMKVSDTICDDSYNNRGTLFYGDTSTYNYLLNCALKAYKCLPYEIPVKGRLDKNISWFAFSYHTIYNLLPSLLKANSSDKSKDGMRTFFIPKDRNKWVKSKSEVIMDDLQSIKSIKIKCWLTIDNMPAIQKNIIIKRKGAEGVTCDEDEWISEFDDSKFLLNMVD
jgi:hypothetical protein